MKTRLVVLFIAFFSLATFSFGQMADPVKWKYEQKMLDSKTVELQFTANIDNGYHMYGTQFGDGGPIRTSFSFEKSDLFSLVGDIKEVTPAVKKHDASFDMIITLHSKKAVFTQKVKINKSEPFHIKGSVEYMACTDESCLPPVQKEYDFLITPSKESVETNEVATPIDTTVVKEDAKPDTSKGVAAITEQKIETETKSSETSSLWGFFILALLAGLAGTITPCVFPMIPMTVSFFMRGSENRAKAIFKGIIFGLTIIAAYTLIGLLVSLTSVGADFANQLSTHWIPNSIFFILFLVFAASFFGMFELVLPGSIINKTDQQADKGGYIGIVFMALATVLVSFSCTGPIVGALLVEAAGGLAMKPILGMFGFGLAFALPFTFFAIFPSSMKSLPKSGGWLNAVKVVLGFVVLAFSLKFFVNIDQTYHFNIISREAFLSIWIAISVLLGIYILGFIRFAHDSVLPHISVPRLIIAIVSFSFAIYLATGLGSNPLIPISSLLPPAESKASSTTSSVDYKSNMCESAKYADILHLPFGLKGYFEYNQALACAKQLNKPILIDFKGHACSNCKKMEATVWSSADVQKTLSENFVLLALYTDDKTELPENEWKKSEIDGKWKKTIGQVNADLQISQFKSNALPYYVIVSPDGIVLSEPIGTELDIQKYLSFLQKGIKASEIVK